jgi:hypothetical protein
MRASGVVEGDEPSEDVLQVRLTEQQDMIQELSRSVPTKRSANAFMFGAPGALRMTRTPTDSRTRVNRTPSFASRSQARRSGTSSIRAKVTKFFTQAVYPIGARADCICSHHGPSSGSPP